MNKLKLAERERDNLSGSKTEAETFLEKERSIRVKKNTLFQVFEHVAMNNVRLANRKPMTTSVDGKGLLHWIIVGTMNLVSIRFKLNFSMSEISWLNTTSCCSEQSRNITLRTKSTLSSQTNCSTPPRSSSFIY